MNWKKTDFKPKYHIYPSKGWMNDPNGLVYFNGYYHVFYQYYPDDSKWGLMHWGHVTSKDLIHWQRMPIALFPDIENGCFSGSAIVKDNKLFLIYTSHDEDNKGNKVERQRLAISEDGIHFAKYFKPIIENKVDDIHDFRDPKIFERNGKYYVIIGSKNHDNKGRVMLYASNNLYNWKYCSTLAIAKSSVEEGNMWECPDLFRLNGQDILLTSPQGIRKKNKKYLNLYQTGYFYGQVDWIDHYFEHGNFNELDSGHDFYATQTFLTPDGRRIMMAWLDMWESTFPEQKENWAGMLIFPRELIFENGQLIQRPISELKKLFSKKVIDKNTKQVDETFSDHQFEIETKVDELPKTFKLKISFGEESLSLSLDRNLLILRKTNTDDRYSLIKENKLILQILCDSSSVEIFVNNGKSTFSERLYGSNKMNLSIKSDQNVKCVVRKLQV